MIRPYVEDGAESTISPIRLEQGTWHDEQGPDGGRPGAFQRTLARLAGQRDRPPPATAGVSPPRALGRARRVVRLRRVRQLGGGRRRGRPTRRPRPGRPRRPHPPTPGPTPTTGGPRPLRRCSRPDLARRPAPHPGRGRHGRRPDRPSPGRRPPRQGARPDRPGRGGRPSVGGVRPAPVGSPILCSPPSTWLATDSAANCRRPNRWAPCTPLAPGRSIRAHALGCRGSPGCLDPHAVAWRGGTDVRAPFPCLARWAGGLGFYPVTWHGGRPWVPLCAWYKVAFVPEAPTCARGCRRGRMPPTGAGRPWGPTHPSGQESPVRGFQGPAWHGARATPCLPTPTLAGGCERVVHILGLVLVFGSGVDRLPPWTRTHIRPVGQPARPARRPAKQPARRPDDRTAWPPLRRRSRSWP